MLITDAGARGIEVCAIEDGDGIIETGIEGVGKEEDEEVSRLMFISRSGDPWF